RGASVHRLLRAAYESAGVTPPSGVVGDSYIRGAFECSRSLRASVGITTMSLPGILSNVANKLLLSAFESVPATWQNIAAVSDVPNFKEAKRYRLTTGHQFDEIPPGGEIKHITMDEEEYTNKAKTYGCIVGLTRQDIVNDDLGAFSTLLRDMVRGGMMSLEKAFYKLLLQTVAAGTFFTTGRGNYIEGAGTVLSITSLTQALATFSMMVDDRGDPLLMVPEVLLVPPALKNAAKLLTRDTSVIAVGVGGSAATVTDGNPHAGDYRPVTSPWLSNEQLTGYTATGWLLAAPPQGGAGLMEVCYLNGQKTPITEEGELDFNRLGVAMRAYWDYGVSMADYRFGLWSKGAA
ncbi:MAG: Mu-like prophage major head subunit gpT family protein, partial [Planctomycetaceae bacterium]|nr:Mu-like prophage major head subunit gpT family protein [Planctomycetaceae bacterium]